MTIVDFETSSSVAAGTLRSSASSTARARRLLLFGQGVYYALTGLWPLVSIESFQRVTGPKTDHLVTGREGDHWLVMTVAVLVCAVAAALLVAAWRRSTSPEAVVLAVAAAGGLSAIDVIYVIRSAIAPIYLADALLECLFLAGWAVVFFARRGQLCFQNTRS
jgi:hypothetical protein